MKRSGQQRQAYSAPFIRETFVGSGVNLQIPVCVCTRMGGSVNIFE